MNLIRPPSLIHKSNSIGFITTPYCLRAHCKKHVSFRKLQVINQSSVCDAKSVNIKYYLSVFLSIFFGF